MMNLSEQKDQEPRCDVRCVCGSLVAKLVPSGVELRCRRCKRTFVVPVIKEEEAASPDGAHRE
jgi:hypothetical protein